MDNTCCILCQENNSLNTLQAHSLSYIISCECPNCGKYSYYARDHDKLSKMNSQSTKPLLTAARETSNGICRDSRLLNLGALSKHKLSMDNKAYNDILDRITNWPISPQRLQERSASNKILYVSIICSLIAILSCVLMVLFPLPWVKIIAELVTPLSLLTFPIYLFLVAWIDFYKKFKTHGFDSFTARSPEIKYTFQLETDFICWLQNYSIFDREFFSERIKSICQKYARNTTILLGEKYKKLGLFSTIFLAAIMAFISLITTDINDITLNIIRWACLFNGILVLGTIVDLHLDNKIDYFVELIKKSIILSKENFE